MLLCGNTWSLSPEIEIACFAELLKYKTLIPNHLKCPITLKQQQFCCFVLFFKIFIGSLVTLLHLNSYFLMFHCISIIYTKYFTWGQRLPENLVPRFPVIIQPFKESEPRRFRQCRNFNRFDFLMALLTLTLFSTKCCFNQLTRFWRNLT